MALVKALNICDYKALISPPLQVYGESIQKDLVTNEANEEGDDAPSASDVPQEEDQEQAFKNAVNEYYKKKGSASKTVAKGFGLNFRITDDGITPLMLACTIGDIDTVKLLCTNKEVDLDKKDDAGINACYISAYYGHKDVFLFLLSKGAAVRSNNKQTTVLHMAAKRGHIALVKCMLEDQRIKHDLKVDATRQNGMTPLIYAVQKNQLRIAQYLKEAGADVQVKHP